VTWCRGDGLCWRRSCFRVLAAIARSKASRVMPQRKKCVENKHHRENEEGDVGIAGINCDAVALKPISRCGISNCRGLCSRRFSVDGGSLFILYMASVVKAR